ncbi:phage repressor protein CI [Pectobacterium aroidearum]|uniref:phage repressor protein CI n=1 Tax=Pectobacterium aroidearum TaxID=1201031 RepID=UPI00263A0CE8|nr:phage repressor protein CI [Pectobacterium aroidearum]WKA61048.1 phage repressor protein CI [Pectobacterium aroidearum]
MKLQGGEAAVQRLMQAYGFKMKKELSDHFGAGTGTISTWVKRDYFPGEAVVRCALETGASLKWLATGEGDIFSNSKDYTFHKENINFLEIPSKRLLSGQLVNDGFWLADCSILGAIPKMPLYVKEDRRSWLIEQDFEMVTDGIWLLNKGGVLAIREIALVPGKKWLIDNIEWPQDEISLLGKITMKQTDFIL